MNTQCILGLLCLTAIHVEAANGTTRLFTEPGSKISVRGANSVHEWMIDGREIEGWIELASAVIDHANETLPEGQLAADGEIAIPVRSLSITGGLTKSMHLLLREASYSQIAFKFQETRVQRIRTGQASHFRLITRGRLAIAGVTNDVTVPIDVFPLDGHRFRLTGKADIKMSSYSIDPPVLQVFGGNESRPISLRYRDDAEVSFVWIVGPTRGREDSR